MVAGEFREGKMRADDSAPQRDSWLASLPQGASLIAVSTHPLNVSITGMLKPMDARGKWVLRFFFFSIIYY